MKNIAWAVMICLLAAVGLVACSGGGGGSSSNSSPLAVKGTSGNMVNMDGTWSRCERDSTDNNDQIVTVSISGSTVTMTLSMWSAPTTANCQQTTTPDAVVTVNMTITVGAEAAATWTNGQGNNSPPTGVPNNAIATMTTSLYNSATATVNAPLWVGSFNNGSMCGKNDWAVGVPTDVLHCTAIIDSTTDVDYMVVDDSATPFKMYTQNIGTVAYQVDSVNPFVKQ